MKTRLIATAIAAIATTAAFAEIGAPPVYVASSPANKISYGNVGHVLFNDLIRLVADVNTFSMNRYAVGLDIAFSNPLLAIGNYRTMRITIKALSDTEFRTTIFAKNKTNGFMDRVTSIRTDRNERTFTFTFSNNVMRYLHTGGNVVLRLICESPTRTHFRMDSIGVSFW
ncbi:MAG TPA: hypothetical protein PLL78_07710 [Fimbriimonadaceae bacterium]|nr:hypothetical protein [Fimbriimonadaceae bacterium]HRJ96559.1 hypothetical protein [Fimbriimonadaceae bacterium]